MEKRATAWDCVHNYVKEWRKCASNDRTWLIFFTIYNSFNPELQSVICMLHRLLTTAGFTHGAWWANFSYLARQPANLNTALYVLSFHTGPDWPSWENHILQHMARLVVTINNLYALVLRKKKGKAHLNCSHDFCVAKYGYKLQVAAAGSWTSFPW